MQSNVELSRNRNQLTHEFNITDERQNHVSDTSLRIAAGSGECSIFKRNDHRAFT